LSKFEKHATAVAKSCNYHAQANGHIRHLLTPELAQALACSLILSGIDYCNALLYGAPTGTTQELQRVQNNAARIVLQMPRRCHAKPLLHSLHWLPLIRESSTRWRWSHSKSSAPQRQPISADTYSPATVCGIYGRRTLLCCVNLSTKLTLPDVVSVTQLLPSGTYFIEQYSKARQQQSSNLGLRLTFLIWLISNSNDVICAPPLNLRPTAG